MRVCAKKSPPSRAAWIEMPLSVSEPYQGCGSRRLHGRRGLKFGRMFCAAVATESPPSRAAWIEIADNNGVAINSDVAAFTGGVD